MSMMKRYLFLVAMTLNILSNTNTAMAALSEKLTKEEILEALRRRQDAMLEKKIDPFLEEVTNEPFLWWVKAELLRRRREFARAESCLKKVFSLQPQYPAAFLTLAYIRYQQNDYLSSISYCQQAIHSDIVTASDQAVAYVLLAANYAQQAKRGGILLKLKYNRRIKALLDEAIKLGDDLPEVLLAIGTYYLKAPKIAGGNVRMAIGYLEKAVAIAPHFATACARLAQAYFLIGEKAKAHEYACKAKEYDPQNEVLRELIFLKDRCR